MWKRPRAAPGRQHRVPVPTGKHRELRHGHLGLLAQAELEQCGRRYPCVDSDLELGAPDGGFRVSKQADNSLRFTFADDTKLFVSRIDSAEYLLLKGKPVHIAVTWDFNQPTGQSVKFYLDGQLTKEGESGQKPDNVTPVAGQFFMIGDSVDKPDAVFDDLKLYDEVVAQ